MDGSGFNIQAGAFDPADPAGMPGASVVEPARELTCYLVEDSAVIRQNLIATLEEMLPLRMVGSAEDESSAVAWIQATGVACDLMLIDIVLKSGTGLEVLRRAHASGTDAKLVVLSNFATADMRRRCQQLGADRVFDKSTELEELLAYCQEIAGPRLQ